MNKEQKKNSKINIKVIISLIIGLFAFSSIVVVTMMETMGNSKAQQLSKSNHRLVNMQNDISKETIDTKKTKILALVKDINKDKSVITLLDIETNQDMVLSYSSGSDIRDKFGQIISMSQIPKGSIVDVEYLTDNSKLLKLQTSKKAWEYVGVNNLLINQKDKIMEIASSKYKYTDNIIVFNGDNIVSVDNLAEQDELTIWGIDEVIWSITVTRGHGIVKLKDLDRLLGGYATIGYEAMVPITEGMAVTVREGTYNMTVENGEFSATMDVTILRNQETEISLEGVGPEPIKYGNVIFNITPFGADLYVDDELTTYSKPLTLSYGDHKVKVSLGGYTTYEGVLTVDKDETSIFIDLPEKKSNEEEDVSDPENNNGDSNIDKQDPEIDDLDPEDTPIIDEDHYIYIQNPKRASVYLNGDFKGISPVNFEKIIGKHVITFIRDGYETKSYTIEVADDGKDAYFNFSDLLKLGY